MDILNSEYYRRCKSFLRFCGHWPYQNSRIKVFNQIFLMSTILTIFVPQMVKMVQIRHNSQEFILSLPSNFYFGNFIFKSIIAALLRKKIKIVLEQIKYDFNTFKNKDLEILCKYYKIANKINTYYTVYMLVAVISYSMLPLTLYTMDIFKPINQTRLPDSPRLIKYFIDDFDDNTYFIILHGLSCDVLAIIFLLGFDTLYFTFVYHACALFVIVTFVDSLQSGFSNLNIFSIACAMIPLSITGFEAIKYKTNFSEMIRFIFFAVAEVIHLLYYNWPGQKIQEHSLMVYETCYNSKWYEKSVPTEYKKLLNFMLLRSQKPCRLTAGTIYILDLQNFAALVKVSVSYFTVLSSLMSH